MIETQKGATKMSKVMIYTIESKRSGEGTTYSGLIIKTYDDFLRWSDECFGGNGIEPYFETTLNDWLDEQGYSSKDEFEKECEGALERQLLALGKKNGADELCVSNFGQDLCLKKDAEFNEIQAHIERYSEYMNDGGDGSFSVDIIHFQTDDDVEIEFMDLNLCDEKGKRIELKLTNLHAIEEALERLKEDA